MLVNQAISAEKNSSTKVTYCFKNICVTVQFINRYLGLIWRMVRWSNASERDKHVYLFIFINVF